MWHRTKVDKVKTRRLWWVNPEKSYQFHKNRKKCSCYNCGNPRRTGLESPKTVKEQAAALFHQDEINEVLYGI